jgi:hypothetical protein
MKESKLINRHFCSFYYDDFLIRQLLPHGFGFRFDQILLLVDALSFQLVINQT